MLVARLVTALTHGVFWSILAVLATRLAPGMSASQATASVYSGISLSIVLGVPTSAAVGQWLGWRVSFALFALLGLGAILGATLALPTVAGEVAQPIKSAQRFDAQLYAASMVTGLVITSHFSSYTYIVPLLRRVALVPEQQLPIMLLAFGVAGVMGTALVGYLKLRAEKLVLLAIFMLILSQLMMLATSVISALVWLQVILWGCSTSALIVSLQSWILELRPNDQERASAFYVSAFNFGIGLGAILGSAVLSFSGLHGVLWTSILAGAATVTCFYFGYRSERLPLNQSSMENEGAETK